MLWFKEEKCKPGDGLPIKKRNNTEPFSGESAALHVQKGS